MEHNFSPEELERQYSPMQWTYKLKPEEAIEHYIETTENGSERVTKNFKCLQLSFGPSHPQKIDIFGDGVLPSNSPIMLYVHGGYWIFGNREHSRYFVPPFHEANIVCAAMSYDLVDVKNKDTVTVPDQVLQVQKGICTLLKYAREKGSRGVFIVGHSAGGHLISMALSSKKPTDIDYNLIKGVIPVSALFDLHTLLSTSNATAAAITKEIAHVCSPLYAIDELKNNLSHSTKIIVAVAQHDSKCFLQHSKVYEEALRKNGLNSEFMLLSEEDHFTVILNLPRPDYIFTKNLIQFINSLN